MHTLGTIRASLIEQAGGIGTITVSGVAATVMPVNSPTPTPAPAPASGFPEWAIVVVIVGVLAITGISCALWCVPRRMQDTPALFDAVVLLYA